MPKQKQKRLVKSKDELMKELKKNAQFIEKMQFAKEKFYPAIVAASRNVEDAQQFLSSINTVLMQEFLGRMKEIKMSDMKLIEKLDAKDEKHDEIVALLSLFNDVSVFEAKDQIESMRSEIQLFINEDMRSRTLDTLKTRWLDEI